MSKFQGLTVVTSSYYGSQDHPRLPIALQTLRAYRESGVEIVVMDSSPDEVNRLLESTGVLVVCSSAGMGEKRREGFRRALNQGAERVLWTEVEKDLTRNLEQINAALLECDVLVPGRRSRDSYPTYQRKTEGWMNQVLNQLVGTDGFDWTFGPRGFSREAAPLFTDYDPQGRPDQYDALYIPVAQAYHRGLSVESLLLDFCYPEDQRKEEEGNEGMDGKRRLQFVDIVGTMSDYCYSLRAA